MEDELIVSRQDLLAILADLVSIQLRLGETLRRMAPVMAKIEAKQGSSVSPLKDLEEGSTMPGTIQKLCDVLGIDPTEVLGEWKNN